MNKLCPICSSNKGFLSYNFLDHSFKKCLNCKSIFSDAIYETNDLDKIYNEKYFRIDYKNGDTYDYFSNKEKKIFGCLEQLKVISEFIFPFKNLKILDVGCAAGYFLELAKRNGFETSGIEISKEAANFARREFNLEIISPDLLSAPDNKKYDIITMFHVLEHLPYPKEHLNKVYNLLNPGGMLFVQVPNLFTLDSIFDKKIKERTFDIPYHLSMISPKGLRLIGKSAGLKIIEERFYFSSVIGGAIKNIFSRFKFKNNSKIKDSEETRGQQLNYSTKRPALLKISSYVFRGNNMMVIFQKK